MNCAKRLRRTGTVPDWITEDDLASVGFEALLVSIRRFDPSRAQLQTYATHRVFGAMQDHVRDTLLIRRRRNIDIPNFGQLSGFVDDKGEEIMFADPAAASPHEKASKDDFWRNTLRGLGSIKCRALEFYYRDGVCMSEIGGRIGLSESRVSQVIAAALNQLRKERVCESIGT